MSNLDFSDKDEARLPYWEPSTESPDIQGTVMDERSITTKYGTLDGAVLAITKPAECRQGGQGEVYTADPGDQVIVWRKNATLKTAWSEPEDGDGESAYYEIVPGDMVRVRYDGMKVSHKYNKSYPIFRVRVVPHESITEEVGSE